MNQERLKIIELDLLRNRDLGTIGRVLTAVTAVSSCAITLLKVTIFHCKAWFSPFLLRGDPPQHLQVHCCGQCPPTSQSFRNNCTWIPLHSHFSHFIPNYPSSDPNLSEADPQVTALPCLCSCKPNATISFQCVTLPITKRKCELFHRVQFSKMLVLYQAPMWVSSRPDQVGFLFFFFFSSRWPAKHHWGKVLGAISVEVPPEVYPHHLIFGIQAHV